ncbi:hypothetical protein [Streptomyces sp. BBFR2]|uniref:hypothetical protein n=1 Tax=Streptomyces sp. BBFR2 TaxID=3372854 RepID=UPI0037DA4052
MMYLVHLTLVPPGASAVLPPGLRSDLYRNAVPDLLDHVSVHPSAEPYPVVGLYLRIGSLEEAESAARDIWNTVSERTALAGWRLYRAEVPLLPPGPED